MKKLSHRDDIKWPTDSLFSKLWSPEAGLSDTTNLVIFKRHRNVAKTLQPERMRLNNGLWPHLYVLWHSTSEFLCLWCCLSISVSLFLSFYICIFMYIYVICKVSNPVILLFLAWFKCWNLLTTWFQKSFHCSLSFQSDVNPYLPNAMW
jgi:hypothetical protein